MNEVIRALSSDKRRKVLQWLRDPVVHFPPQRDGDLVTDGVCVVSIADKLGVSQPTATEHMKVLHAAGLVTAKRVKTWAFYRRDEDGIASARKAVMRELAGPKGSDPTSKTPSTLREEDRE